MIIDYSSNKTNRERIFKVKTENSLYYQLTDNMFFEYALQAREQNKFDKENALILHKAK